MDDADRAGDNIDRFEADAIAYCTEESKHRALKPVGFCHYCNEVVVHGMLFCEVDDNECAKDWAYEQARKKANGS